MSILGLYSYDSPPPSWYEPPEDWESDDPDHDESASPEPEALVIRGGLVSWSSILDRADD